MEYPSQQAIWSGIVAQARRQHGVIHHRQLRALGISAQAIKRLRASSRLYPLHREVYAVGRPEVTDLGRWHGAVLACGEGAALSHSSAARLWGIVSEHGAVEVSVPGSRTVTRPGIRVHRRAVLSAPEVTEREGIPVTTPARTLVDIALHLRLDRLERAINEADRLDLIDLDALRESLDDLAPGPGVGILRRTIDRRSFTLTDSGLERLFLPLASRAGLPRPLTRQVVDGYRVDFHWPDLGLVVETDGLRYHRTPLQQARDRVRDQAHLASGRTALRFTHDQVAHEAAYVIATLRRVARNLSA